MNTTNETASKPPAGTTAREDFAGRELAVLAETQAAAVAAQASATVQARYLMALKRPRDPDQVRVALLKECSRPGFAAVARYRKPIGKGVEGLSVRFAEAAVRCMTNILIETTTVYDDERKRIVRVTVTDLEANVPYSRDVSVEKTVERTVVKPGQVVLSQRTNARGMLTYLVQATDDELLNKEGALVSKAFRTLALRLIPGDLKEEAEKRVIEVLEKGASQDPDAERKKIADAFASLGVQPAALKDYLGHDLAQCSPSEIVELRAVWKAIDDGEATWADTIAARSERDTRKSSDVEAKASPAVPEKPKSAADLKAEARASRETTAPQQPKP